MLKAAGVALRKPTYSVGALAAHAQLGAHVGALVNNGHVLKLHFVRVFFTRVHERDEPASGERFAVRTCGDDVSTSRPLTLLEVLPAEPRVLRRTRAAETARGWSPASRGSTRASPRQPTLRRLSFFHQLHAGRCDETAFCCTTVFAAQEERARAVFCCDHAPSRAVRPAVPHPGRRGARYACVRPFKPSRC